MSRNISILHVIGSMGLGGAETMVMNIFRKIDRSRFQFDFVVFGEEKGYYEEEAIELGAKIYHLTKRTVSFRKNTIEFYRTVRDNEYSIVHFHTQNAFLTSIQALVAKVAGARKIIIHSHSAMDWRSKPYLILHKLFRPLLNLITTIKLACGEAAAQWLYGTVKNVQIVPLPVFCEKYKYSDALRATLREQYGINEETLVFSHIGRFSDVKNHNFLINIYNEIVKSHPDSLLFLMGDGALRAKIEDKVKILRLEEKVIFCGNVSDVNEKLILSDAFLFPSKYEGFPTVVLEAQAAGLQCLISNTITEKVVLTDNVIQLPIDKGVKVWANAALRMTCPSQEDKQVANRSIAQKYDISCVAEVFEKIYLGK